MYNPMSLEGNTIVITGASQGIGQSVAEVAYELGANLVMVDVNEEGLAAAKKGFDEDRIMTCCGSVTNSVFINSALKGAQSRFGALHGLVNSAGVVRPAMIEKMSEQQWDQVIDVNLTGCFRCIQSFGALAIEGIKRGDSPAPRSIVNVSSIAGRAGTVGQINYSAAKAGLFGITMSTAREWSKYNIRSNAVCFGVVETPMTEVVRGEKFREQMLARIPLGRWAEVREASLPINFFLSEASSYITGQLLSVDGGGFMSS